jgi:hypothetical protein
MTSGVIFLVQVLIVVPLLHAALGLSRLRGLVQLRPLRSTTSISGAIHRPTKIEFTYSD